VRALVIQLSDDPRQMAANWLLDRLITEAVGLVATDEAAG